MEKVLYFLSNYNAQIIQAGFAIVFLLIIVYVYRAFFMAGSLSGDVADVAHSPAIEQKLNQILEIQRTKSGHSPSAGTTADGTSTGLGSARGQNTEVEIDKLKAEIYNLRQQLNDVEKSSGDGDSKSSIVVSATQLPEALAQNDAANSKASEEMVIKVKELETRLAEYEIIADDIAELSQLRADNAKLKEQLSKVQGPTPATDVTLEPKSVDAEITAGAKPKINEAKTPAATEELSGQAAIDALFASVTADLASEPVAANEQDLINEFEKITQKKDDE